MSRESMALERLGAEVEMTKVKAKSKTETETETETETKQVRSHVHMLADRREGPNDRVLLGDVVVMRSRRPSHRARRGFTLLIVVLVMAMLALMGMIIIDVVHIETQMIGARRVASEAQQVAEGALGEAIDDTTLNSILPNPTESNLTVDYQPSTQSFFSGSATSEQPERAFEATVSMVRSVTVNESSLNIMRAFMYEIDVNSKVGYGDATDTAQSAVYKLFSFQTGTVLPEVHAR